jgi:DNA polymerase (family 10)
MPVHNADIARIFEEMADLLELSDANPFRIRAYRNAARLVGDLQLDIAATLASGATLPKLPGIGHDLDSRIHEIVATGHCTALDRLRRTLPPAITEMLCVPGIGPKRVKALYHELGVETLPQLYKAAREGRLRALHGFGEKTEARVLHAAEAHPGESRRFKLAVAAQYAAALVEYLHRVPGVRVVAPQSIGAALHYFTGSKAQNIAVRRIAQEHGLKLNEYGVFRGERRMAGETEESVFAAVGLPWIAPELREDRGEIEAARAGKLPRLVEHSDLRGDLHVHTKWTDGHETVREMAEAAAARGLSYIAITDHSRRLTVAHGLDPQRLRKQCDEIARVSASTAGIALLTGIEVDILEDGTLDLPDAVLAELDVVIAAVHSRFDLSRERQTERIVRALAHPAVGILAHPIGRLIDRREPYDVDMLKVVRKAKASGVFLELNAHPERLDLIDTHCRMAKDEGVLVSVNSDAHSALEFDNLKFGIRQARRGWLEKADVLNTRGVAEVKRLLRQRRAEP